MQATGRSPRVAAALALVAVLVLCAADLAPAAVEPEPVATGRRGQFLAFANGSYVVYSRDRAKGGTIAIAEAIADGTVTRLNRRGTLGAVGGIDPGTNRVLYAETRLEGPEFPTRHTAYFYDLDAGERSEVPELATAGATGLPLVSATFFLFGRSGARRTSLHLLERESGEVTRIGSWMRRSSSVLPGSVGDRYVTFGLLRSQEARLFLYDSVTRARQRIPTTEGTWASMPVVDETNSTVYFAETTVCNEDATVWRLPLDLDGEPTKILELPAGVDPGIGASLALNGATGHIDLYMDFADCRTEDSDIYVLRAVDEELPGATGHGG